MITHVKRYISVLICYLRVTARVEVEVVGYDFNPVADMRVLASRRETRRIAYPSGSRTKAMPFSFPSLGFFLKATPSASNRAHALSTSSTVMAMWPYPLPGSVLPLA
jgi:D-mannonate dehydratase